jgi:hypothetical protein
MTRGGIRHDEGSGFFGLRFGLWGHKNSRSQNAHDRNDQES